MSAVDATRLQSMARHLRFGTVMTAATMLGLVVAALGATAATRPALVLSALLGSGAAGLSGLWLGIRTGFDALIFARWARDAASGRLDLGAFDAAMVRRGLMPAAKAGRNIDARIAGATGLLRRHALMLAIQIGLLTLALVLLILRS